MANPFPDLFHLGPVLALLAWAAWWLWGVNWSRVWPVLARGGWLAVVLVVLLGSLAWSQVFPREPALGWVRLPNFWWQLGVAVVLTLATLWLGWLQGILGWAPGDPLPEPTSGEALPEHDHPEHSSQ